MPEVSDENEVEVNLRTLLTSLIVMGLQVSTVFAASPRRAVSLDQGWRFKTGEIAGASAPGFDDKTWETVTVPHMFPLVGDDANRKSTYRGEAWYRNTFEVPAAWKGQRIFVRFDAVSLVSDTYLNGEHLGEHRGGFAAFTYEITGKLHYGGPNRLAVRVDDRWNNDVAPLETSLLYGGIYRHVSLIVTGPVNITPMDFSSPGVFLRQSAVTGEQAVVDVKTEVDNGTSESRSVVVRIALLSGTGKVLLTSNSSSATSPNKTVPVLQKLTIQHPHLWNGVADPYLYSVRVDLMDGGKIVDTVTQPLGLRFFHFEAKTGFTLNGTGQQIHGVCLHQDWGTLQWAIGPEQEQQDLGILRDMGVTGIRLVHYQHSQSALDLYDKSGMLIWSELAQFRLVSASEAYRRNVEQQLTEMIRQNYNHPSIIMWSLYNELASTIKVPALPIVKDLNAIAHTEDPTRPTVAAASGDTIANMHDVVAAQDLIGDNNYAGWYFGAPEDMNKEIDKWNAFYDYRGLGLTEYGGGARITDHKQNLVTGDVKPYGAFQPEEWQALVHEGNYRAIKNRPFVWGSFVWQAFDAQGTPRSDGTIQGGNIKGLVTQDRKVKKDAYFFYQANWAARPMVYLTSRRDTERTEAVTPVKAYSNAATVMLTVNGKSYGTQKPDDLHVFHWKKVELEPGENHVVVTGPDGLRDEAVWNYKARP